MKVGKAIYNILSQSTDVQSNFPFNTTDYSPTGTELVTNGDFSATGSEQVPDGSPVMSGSWNGSNTVSGGQLTKTSGGLSYKDNVDLSVAKYWKVVVDVAEKNGSDLKFYFGEGTTQVPLDEGVNTLYLVNGTSNNFIGVNNGNGSIINSISVKELGEDWYLFSNTEPIFNASGVTLNTSNGFDQTINHRNVITSGKSYKVTYQITAATYTTGSKFDYYDGDSYVNFPEQGVGTHTFYYTSENPASDRWYMKLRPGSGTDEVTLSSISVEEMVLNKIFPELAPPDIDAPYVVYSVVSNSPSDTKNANGDIDTASIEVYGFQDTYNKAVDLGVSVRAALDRKTGTYNTIEIQSTNYVNEQMDVNEARKLWAAIQDYSIRIKNL